MAYALVKGQSSSFLGSIETRPPRVVEIFKYFVDIDEGEIFVVQKAPPQRAKTVAAL